MTVAETYVQAAVDLVNAAKAYEMADKSGPTASNVRLALNGAHSALLSAGDALAAVDANLTALAA